MTAGTTREAMARQARGRPRLPPGSAPGTLVADPNAPKPVISAIGYGPDGMVECPLDGADAVEEFLGKWPVVWINVDGLGDVDVIQRLGEVFELHRLAIEDVVNVHQRAKVEDYESHYFIVVRMPSVDKRIESEQVTLFFGERFVLTFQERSGDCFDPVRERIRKGKGRLRRAGADYLTYTLIDAVVDSYFPVMEHYGERLDNLEDELLSDPAPDTMSRTHEIKRDLLSLRRMVWPQRDATNSLIRDENPLVSDETRVYLRDCYDHAVQLMDLVETYRDLSSGLMEFYMSVVSNRMNEVMKVLTIIATIFIPLTFIAGIYGMNFDAEASPWNMPELGWYWGYPLCLAAMAVVTVVLVVFFKKRRWL